MSSPKLKNNPVINGGSQKQGSGSSSHRSGGGSSGGKVTKFIDLTNKKLTELPSDLESYKVGLEKLSLFYNQLSTLPKFLKNFEHLVHLNLRSNNFTEFPKVLCYLPNLEILDISRNKLRMLPKEANNLLELRMLNISKNHLVTLPSYIGKMHRLEILKIENNPFHPSLELLDKVKMEDKVKWLIQLKKHLLERENNQVNFNRNHRSTLNAHHSENKLKISKAKTIGGLKSKPINIPSKKESVSKVDMEESHNEFKDNDLEHESSDVESSYTNEKLSINNNNNNMRDRMNSYDSVMISPNNNTHHKLQLCDEFEFNKQRSRMNSIDELKSPTKERSRMNSIDEMKSFKKEAINLSNLDEFSLTSKERSRMNSLEENKYQLKQRGRLNSLDQNGVTIKVNKVKEIGTLSEEIEEDTINSDIYNIRNNNSRKSSSDNSKGYSECQNNKQDNNKQIEENHSGNITTFSDEENNSKSLSDSNEDHLEGNSDSTESLEIKTIKPKKKISIKMKQMDIKMKKKNKNNKIVDRSISLRLPKEKYEMNYTSDEENNEEDQLILLKKCQLKLIKYQQKVNKTQDKETLESNIILLDIIYSIQLLLDRFYPYITIINQLEITKEYQKTINNLMNCINFELKLKWVKLLISNLKNLIQLIQIQFNQINNNLIKNLAFILHEAALFLRQAYLNLLNLFSTNKKVVTFKQEENNQFEYQEQNHKLKLNVNIEDNINNNNDNNNNIIDSLSDPTPQEEETSKSQELYNSVSTCTQIAFKAIQLLCIEYKISEKDRDRDRGNLLSPIHGGDMLNFSTNETKDLSTIISYIIAAEDSTQLLVSSLNLIANCEELPPYLWQRFLQDNSKFLKDIFQLIDGIKGNSKEFDLSLKESIKGLIKEAKALIILLNQMDLKCLDGN